MQITHHFGDQHRPIHKVCVILKKFRSNFTENTPSPRYKYRTANQA